MKVLFLIVSCATLIFSSPTVDVKLNELKITSGIDIKTTEHLDFVYMTLNFYEKQKTCGGVIATPFHVLTTARCVYDCSENTASNVTIFFPTLGQTRSALKIFIPGEAGEFLGPYDAAEDTPSTTIVGGNVALIKLSAPLPVDNSKYRPSVFQKVVDTDVLLTFLSTNGYKTRACGVGNINNKGEKAKGVRCTEVKIVPNDQCKKYGTPSDLHTVPEGLACVQWPDRDNNICAGDYGGPIYAYDTDEKGVISSKKTVCLTIGSPDYRPNAPCQGGQTVFCQLYTPLVELWIGSVGNL